MDAATDSAYFICSIPLKNVQSPCHLKHENAQEGL